VPANGAHAKAVGPMKRNGHANWTIADVATVCRSFGLDATPPTEGSYYVVSHPRVAGLLTVPAKRPIKPIYIELLAQLIEGSEAP
jgi:hypothetical protein